MARKIIPLRSSLIHSCEKMVENHNQMTNSALAAHLNWAFSENLSYHCELRREKTGLRGFRPGLTQTDIYSHKLEILDLRRSEIVLSV